MHTPTEVISLKDVQHAVRLITRFALDMGEEPHFVPGIDGTCPRSFLRAEDDPYIPTITDEDTELDALLVALEQEEATEKAAADEQALSDEVDETVEEDHPVEYTAEMQELIARAEEAKQLAQEQAAAASNAMPSAIPEADMGNTGVLMPEDNIPRPRF